MIFDQAKFDEAVKEVKRNYEALQEASAAYEIQERILKDIGTRKTSFMNAFYAARAKFQKLLDGED